jgi:Skp family chaperone for outer membrane proteins
MQRSTITILAVVGASAAAFLAGTSIATSYRPAPQPAMIATVNIQNIFEAYAERADKLKQLTTDAAELEGKFNAMNRNNAKERDDASKMPEGPAKEAAMDLAVDHDVQTQIEMKKAKNKLEKAQADTIRTIFDKIQKKADAIGTSAGYTMVMAADDWVTISPRATSQEATQVMSLKRFLSIDNKVHDITAAVLKALNDDYAATKPATPTPAGATPAAGTPKPAH